MASLPVVDRGAQQRRRICQTCAARHGTIGGRNNSAQYDSEDDSIEEALDALTREPSSHAGEDDIDDTESLSLQPGALMVWLRYHLHIDTKVVQKRTLGLP